MDTISIPPASLFGDAILTLTGDCWASVGARVDRADASGSVESVPPEEHELPHYWAIYAFDEVERWVWIADVLTERAARLVAGAYLLQASPWWKC